MYRLTFSSFGLRITYYKIAGVLEYKRSVLASPFSWCLHCFLPLHFVLVFGRDKFYCCLIGMIVIISWNCYQLQFFARKWHWVMENRSNNYIHVIKLYAQQSEFIKSKERHQFSCCSDDVYYMKNMKNSIKLYMKSKSVKLKMLIPTLS